MRYMIMDDDMEKGILSAKRSKTLFTPSIKINVKLKQIDINNTQVFVDTEVGKHWRRYPEKKLNHLEDTILSSIS